MELKLKEKENEYRMINLKIKELKRTIQGTYVQKAGSKTREERKKSARSVNKVMRPPNPVQQVLRPSSSKKRLAEVIMKETEKQRNEFIMPIEHKAVSRGVDFNGGDDEPYEQNYDHDDFEKVETKPYKSQIGKIYFYHMYSTFREKYTR